MIPAFRFLLIPILLFASGSASAQSESKVLVNKTGAKYLRSTCRYAQTGDQDLQSTTARSPSPRGEGGVR
ncbi:hypothetical protein B0E43_13210 [Algoriphagus sp. A40]|nr:hypothetical protein B0E43_13210 [Algoriphagus sp. A40]